MDYFMQTEYMFLLNASANIAIVTDLNWQVNYKMLNKEPFLNLAKSIQINE